MIKIKLDKYKAVIFDMDGTMVDSNPWHKKAFEILCKKNGVKLAGDFFNKQGVGRRNLEIFPEVFKNKSEKEINNLSLEKEAIFRKVYKPYIKEVKGLTKLINKLRKKGLPLAISTTAPEKNRDFFLKSLGLSKRIFRVIVGDEDVKKGKPHPEIYLKTAKKLRVKPEECVVFEDSKSGVKSAKSAGMTVIAVVINKMRETLKGQDYLISNFSEIDLA